MKIKRFKQNSYQVSNWSGGKTTQICLSPPDGEYQLGQFDYRLSSAEIMLEQTEFSALSGYKRLIMSLDKTLTLIHLDSNKKKQERFVLEAFQPHYFDGGQQTISYGKCTDFNLIYRPEYQGNMALLEKKQSYRLKSKSEHFVYALTDSSIELYEKNIQSQCLQIKTGDGLFLSELATTVLLTAIPQNEEAHNPLAILTTIQYIPKSQ